MPIHRTIEELSRPFGIAPSIAGNKASELRKMVSMSPWHTEWMLRSLIEHNPAIWMLSVDGSIVDAHDLPPDIQQKTVHRGLIHYVLSPKPEKQLADNPVPESARSLASEDQPSEPALPADFSDIYERFRTV